MKFDDILELVFNPFFLATANFCTFAVLLAYGTLTINPLISYASFGFLIGGISIGVLAVVGKWVNSQEYEEEQTQETGNPPIEYKIAEGVKDGVQAGKAKVQTNIEI